MTTDSHRSEVRAAGRAARKAVEGEARSVASTALVTHLQQLQSVCDADWVGVFVADDGEPDLMPLVSWLWAEGVGVALPVLRDDPNDFSMRFMPWLPEDKLQPARYGIPVPPSRAVVDLDLVLVSFVGFDARGNRIGRGGGFFDRYLATTTADVIGVGFEVQRFANVPVQAHDEPLPAIVTDLGIRYCL